MHYIYAFIMYADLNASTKIQDSQPLPNQKSKDTQTFFPKEKTFFYEKSKEQTNGLTKQEMFKDPSCQYFPLEKQPTSFPEELLLDATLKFIGNKEVGVKGTILYAYENDLPAKSPVEKNLRYKLRMLKNVINQLELTKIQQAAIKNIKIRLIDRESIKGADALVTPDSGSIYVSSDLDVNEYPLMIGNELHHVEIRYINLKKCGVENLPDDRITLFYPFLNQDWTVNLELRNELEQTIYLSGKKLNDFLKNPASDTKALKLVNAHHKATGKDVFSDFKKKILGRQAVAITTYSQMGGRNRRLFEQLSDVFELAPPLRDYFYSKSIEYLDKYSSLACENESQSG